MIRENSDKIVLAIESAVEGGSLSLLRGSLEVASHLGASGVSRAEDLLADINVLLESNGMSPRDLDIVAASAGPGSFTGVRIGIATALGLARGSGARFASASLLRSCAVDRLRTGECIVAIPVGRGAAAVQTFRFEPDGVNALSPPEIVPAEKLADLLQRDDDNAILLHFSLIDMVGAKLPVEAVGPNLARLIGLECRTNPVATEPIFLSKNLHS